MATNDVFAYADFIFLANVIENAFVTSSRVRMWFSISNSFQAFLATNRSSRMPV